MTKLEEFREMLKQVDREIAEKEEYREEILFRIDKELTK